MVCKIMALLCIISSELRQGIQKVVTSAATVLPAEAQRRHAQRLPADGEPSLPRPEHCASSPAHQPGSPPSGPNTNTRHEILKPQLPAREDSMFIRYFQLTFKLFDTFINQHHYVHFKDDNPDT